MSVRIHQLSKQIGLENKELISLLQKRGFPVTSASSTIDNISAESLVNEFKGKEEADAEETSPKMKTSEKEKTKSSDDNQNDADDKPSIQLPPGVFVKSADDVIREREEKAAAAEAAKAPAARPKAPVPPPVQRAPAAKTPPPPPPAPARPVVKSPPPPPAARPPATPPVARKSPPAPPTPPAPASPSPEAAADKKGEKAQATAPKETKPTKTPDDDKAASEAETDEEEIKVIAVRPPIVVRDFAGMIGRKPFQLISELMEMGIFASMNQVIEADVANDLAARHGYLLDIRVRGEGTVKGGKAKKKAEPVDETKFLEPRPP